MDDFNGEKPGRIRAKATAVYGGIAAALLGLIDQAAALFLGAQSFLAKLAAML
ncbi:MAG: hypothetical protein AAGI03_00515 [Pseudomonadota bacterium]